MSRTISRIAAALGARAALVLAAAAAAALAVAVPVAWPALAATARQTAAAGGPPVATAAAPAVPAATSVTVTSHFVDTPDSSDISGDYAVIDNGATNGQPGDLVFVTPNYTPGGVCCTPLEPGMFEVYYTTGSQWAIARVDGQDMPAGVSFNVLVVPPNQVGESAFVHTAKKSNTGGNHTFLDSPLINGKPNALIQVTQVYNGKTVNGDAHNVGVVYDPVNKRWAIFNEDNADMLVGAVFNVLIGSAPSNGGQAMELTTTSSNKRGNTTFFSNPQSTGNPNNITFVTQNWNPGGGDDGTYNNAQTGVYYAGSEEGVFDENNASMPLNAAFNLLIFSG
jgi:hypothetical protein